MQAAAQAIAQPLLVVRIGTEVQAKEAFATVAERKVGAIFYAAKVYFQGSESI